MKRRAESLPPRIHVRRLMKARIKQMRRIEPFIRQAVAEIEATFQFAEDQAAWLAAEAVQRAKERTR